ncbi:MAG TPA: DNA topoisomerase (ATP-hydrolyzing) subunit B [Bacteroidales bacterium]|jgi:DNA gyrase subunit B|nr:MAG: DNA gyrase subunit B [Bacteroidetes bacterium ADurb.Bin035]HNY75405.1 DNA topoisomerase (ATP-hydrolyzing) subunit B [Bacteroidales bacterium]HOC40045.1 DNA topoisomerase (ATP-hydrolyzing) subunit B [Bacteroidales bacterium]HOF06906.1 DNA topoisomerase (ATP-hydrolyzing) subunit B [Bacteroidales bacterium]HOH93358.1 DNA topoisomerase (ATP-hydrolyzing) subunit B [Bacteroidales bacterium]
MDEKIQENGYNANNIQVLEGLEAVRKRPAMYIGDTGERGLHHLVYEVLDNSIDEALAGYCDHIKVIIHPNDAITVIDNGRGIPVDMHPIEKKPALEVVLTVLHAGGKFNKDTYKVSGGLHGVGVSCVNALSKKMIATIKRDGKIWQQTYAFGKPITELQAIGETMETGTTIYFEPDETIFPIVDYKYDILSKRLKELSFLNKGVKIELIDQKSNPDDPIVNVYHSENGLIDFIHYLDESRQVLMPEPIYIEGEKDNIKVEIAFEYNDSYIENVHTFVNNINTIEGGTHLAGFRRALTRTMKAYGDAQGYFDKVKFEISGDDFREGLTAILSVKVPEPQFEGQTKTKLGNTEVAGIVDTIVSEHLSYYLQEHPKETREIFNKVVLAATARHAARKAREMVLRKTVFNSAQLPGKLADCSENDPSKCEIFLVEGDSAGGTAKQGRNRLFQAILPLRGKILNVEKAADHRVFESEEIRNIYTALGVSIGTPDDPKALNLEKLRYHKIIIMTDADVDGSHITTLILTFFFRYMKELIEKGYVYVAAPPLYQIRQGNRKIYCWSDEQRDKILSEWKQNYGDKNIHTQRYKGLGEMNAEQLWETTMNPDTRFLNRVSIENAAEADRIFSMLMGEDVPPRRQFIEENARLAKIDA